jgi:GAF domain-containing protein
MRAQDPGDRFAAIARDLENQESESETVERMIALAVETIHGCDYAGVSVVDRRRRITTAAATDDRVQKADQEQYDLDQGPCLDAIRQEQTISCPQLATDSRWPDWGSWVADNLEIRSMLCFQLFTTGRSYGSLNLYSSRPDAFDEHDETIGLALAAHAAVALARSRLVDNLNVAVVNRTIIGQAEGILMERYNIDSDQAFSMLSRVSQAENRRLNAIAEELIRTRSTPGLTRPETD